MSKTIPISKEILYIGETNRRKLRQITLEIEERLVNIKRDVFEIGKLLSKAKSVLPHGAFQKWVKQTFSKDLPYSTAQLYMKIYDTFQNQPKTVQLIPLHFLMSMTQNTFPEKIRDLINEHAENLEKEDIDGVNEAFRQFKEGEIKRSEFERIADRYIKLGFNIAQGLTHRRIVKNAREGLHSQEDNLINQIRSYIKRTQQYNNMFPPEVGEERVMVKKIDIMINQLKQLKAEVKGETRLFFKRTLKNPLEGEKQVSNL